MEKVRFSYSGEYAAVSGIDGRLRIWETETNNLKHEFTPSSHLSASCTCLEWAPTKEKHKRKRKRVVKSEIVVMGTAVGSLLFYDVVQAELVAQSKEAHSGKVTGLAWSSISLILYSCGEDGCILEWDTENTNVTRSWKGSKNGLSSVQVFQDNLLAAGQVITLWDLKKKISIATFTGHPNHVIQMEAVPQSNYFVTMGRGERFLKIWSTAERNCIATLSVPEIPQFFNLITDSLGQVTVSVVTQKGQLHLFQHKVNGPIRKPISPLSTLKIAESSDTTTNVPILASCLSPLLPSNVITAYGSWTNLRFESFEISSFQNQTLILREVFVTSSKYKSKSRSSHHELMEVPEDVKHLQSGTEEAIFIGDKLGKRKAEKPSDGELPMEERLTNLTISTSTSGIRENNLAYLLSQGLHSKDARILQSVLSRWDEEVISNTIRSLPVQLVVPLLNETKQMLAGKGQLNNSILKWIKTILQVHSSYLMCCPSTEELLSPFMSLLRTREILYPRMCQLKGKLQLIKGHIESKQYRNEPTNEALLVFNDDSTEEVDDEDDIIPMDSDAVLSSDDLGVEEGDSTDAEKESDAEGSETKLTESEESADENVNVDLALKETKINKKSKKMNHINLNNSKKKRVKETISDDGRLESMDEDA